MSNSDDVSNETKSAAAVGMPPLEQILRGRRIMLTGATGFLGKVLLYLLLRHHPEIGRIYLLIRGDRKSSLNRFRREILDSPALGPLRESLALRFDHYIEEHVAVVAGDITLPGLVSDDAGTDGGDPGARRFDNRRGRIVTRRLDSQNQHRFTVSLFHCFADCYACPRQSPETDR